MIANGSENVLCCGWGNLRGGGAVPPSADLYGLASHDRGLVGTDVGEVPDPSKNRPIDEVLEPAAPSPD
jgi:hypothetical protein